MTSTMPSFQVVSHFNALYGLRNPKMDSQTQGNTGIGRGLRIPCVSKDFFQCTALPVHH
jgi:hypothetical protein